MYKRQIYTLAERLKKKVGEFGYINTGIGSVFIDTGKNPILHETYLDVFENEVLKALLDIKPEYFIENNIICILSPEVEDNLRGGKIKVDKDSKALFISSKLNEGRIEGNVIVVDSDIDKLTTQGDALIWSTRAPPKELIVSPRQIIADLYYEGNLERVEFSLDRDPEKIYARYYPQVIKTHPKDIQKAYLSSSPLSVLDFINRSHRALEEGKTFDLILITTLNDPLKEYLTEHFKEGLLKHLPFLKIDIVLPLHFILLTPSVRLH